MITQKDILKVVGTYGSDITVGTLGGHSALDVCRGAKDLGLRTVVVCQRGREKTYAQYYRSREGRGIVDEIILVDRFADIVKKEVQERLRSLNTIFVQSRYFWVYCNYKDIENRFRVPLFGTRCLLKAEERTGKDSQYRLLEAAGIKVPRMFRRPQDIDRLVIVKAAEAERGYERAFFFAGSYAEYQSTATELLKKGSITKASLKNAVIEEFVVGPQINLNFFWSPLSGELELLGTDTRRQTNMDGLLRLTADMQEEVMKRVKPSYIENGHIAVTIKESLLEKAFPLGEQFVEATRKRYPPGIIGPFALQGAVTAGPPREEFVIFDVSLRIPGSPGTRYTPYGNYLYGMDISVGRRIAMEIAAAVQAGKLGDIVT